MNITYPGPHEAVKILATGQTVRRDESIEVDADLGTQLVAQGWKPTPTPKPKPKASTASKKENV